MRQSDSDPSATGGRPAARARAPRFVHELSTLTKARLSGLVVATTAVGYVLASGPSLDWAGLAWTLLGTALAAFSAAAMNQWMEIAADARMERTRQRPLPAGRLTPRSALAIGSLLIVAGVGLLMWRINVLTAALALFVWLVYLVVYTPLKKRSTLCTLAGAVCGAVPPMMGWAAAAGRLDFGAWILAAVLFAWQIPHFLALAWLYRDDYARGGFRMLTVVDPGGESACQQILLYTLTLILAGLAAGLAGMAGTAYVYSGLALGVWFFALGVRLFIHRTRANARRLFLASLVYLPLMLGMMVVDRAPAPRASSAEPSSSHSIVIATD